ncbi:MAG: HNH endonuclease family protein [Actinocatenispora sp.]
MPSLPRLRRPTVVAGMMLAVAVVLCVGVGVTAVKVVTALARPSSTATEESSVDLPGGHAPTATARPAAAPTDAPVLGELAGSQAADALRQLATLPVRPADSSHGYSPYDFGPSWLDTDHNGCDNRNDVLRRDLTHVTAGSHGCEVLAGRLRDPYSGSSITYAKDRAGSSAVRVDHVVSLADAWRTGARTMSRARREQFANDPLALLAVASRTGADRDSRDAAGWLPPYRSFRCAYVADQVAVKAAYGLWVTRAEHDAMTDVLSVCAGRASASPSPSTARSAQVPTAPATAGGTASSTAPGTDDAGPGDGTALKVQPGAVCGREGAYGVTSSGRLMQCSREAGADRPRWRPAG